jgi:hypothetical protein
MITSSFVSQACTRANSQYNAPAKQAVSWQSEVLTVRRRLHIERDSMQAPPNRILPRPCLPDLSWLQDNDNPNQNLFAWAYIRPIDDGEGNVGNNQANLPFRSNVESFLYILQATVVHEIGHMFGAGENEGGVMNQGCSSRKTTSLRSPLIASGVAERPVKGPFNQRKGGVK